MNIAETGSPEELGAHGRGLAVLTTVTTGGSGKRETWEVPRGS